ncbi:DUF4113 domain-containing protein [Methylophilus sp. TWE2]
MKTAAEGEIKPWQMQRSFKSLNYTGEWADLLKVN